jgi:hypothetical protein
MSGTQTAPKIRYSPKAYVIHDEKGEVISVGRVPLNIRGKVEIRPRNKAHAVLEVELSAEQDSLSVLELHQTHKLHVDAKKLVKK